MDDLELNVEKWKSFLKKKGRFSDEDLLELENHLRDEMDDLKDLGLSAEEAFLISVKRFGNMEEISREYSKVNTQNLWKQLLLKPEEVENNGKNRQSITMVILFSLLSGTLMKLPELFGISFSEGDLFYLKNLSFFILPFVALFFLIKNQVRSRFSWGLLAVFPVLAIVINLYPYVEPQDTLVLTSLHLPLFLWLITGVFYLGEDWRSSRERMNFVRFSGEAFIYGTLIMCGLLVLMVFIMAIFSAIDIEAEGFVTNILLFYGGAAAVMITVYLAETKKSIVENFAPVLAKIFSPLFLVTMCVFLIMMLVTGRSPFMERDFLIAFDFMLMMVLGLVLYVISSRTPNETAGFFDYQNLALILCALIIDGIALSAIVFRLSAYGITPNKLAALGENVVMLINLLGLAFYYIGFIFRKSSFRKLENFQTAYFNVYAIWLAVVALLFPLFFRFA